MRICHYPGRAIDATLSLDHKSPMETIYQNNWLNADKTIKTIGRSSAAAAQRNSQFYDDATASKSPQHKYGQPLDYMQFKSRSSASGSSSAHQSGSSDEENRRTSQSSLGRYQVTLEEMQKLDLNQSNGLFKKTLRDLNGYKPSTVRQKPRRYYDCWDDYLDDKPSPNGTNSNNHVPAINGESKSIDWPSSNGYTFGANRNNQIPTIPKIKRSQTVRYTSTSNDNRVNSLNIKNLFNQQMGDQNRIMPTATINKTFNRIKRNNLLAIQNEFNESNNNDRGELNGTHFTSNKLNGVHDNNGLTAASNQFTNKSNGNNPVNGAKANGKCDNPNENSQQQPNGKAASKSLFRAKSVRINPTPIQDVHFDRAPMIAKREQNGTNGTINCDNKRQNSKDAAYAQQHQKLPRLTSIMKKRPPIVIQDQPQQQQQHSKEILSQWIDYHKKQQSNENGVQQALPPPPPQQQQQQQQKQKQSSQLKKDSSSSSSLSSISSSCCDCNSNVSDFSIPRPRLIVPVHTYARKRRTGNLIQNRAGERIGDNGNGTVVIEQPRNYSSNRKNGKIFEQKEPN